MRVRSALERRRPPSRPPGPAMPPLAQDPARNASGPVRHRPWQRVWMDRLADRKVPSISIVQEVMNLVEDDDLGSDMLIGATHVVTEITKAAMFCTPDAANRKLFSQEWI
ncbi:hypothetical protein DFS34DRAFT_590012 [Phlyctochytrium arcticum]|nr:hypothetical protein DFS34DRAFT_590012 [Phlyctochytrium arcticum]